MKSWLFYMTIYIYMFDFDCLNKKMPANQWSDADLICHINTNKFFFVVFNYNL